jgi:hypothetical protein
MPSFVGPFPEANRIVRGGPRSLPSWFVVSSDPSGRIAKPAGTVAFLLSGLRAWRNKDGTAAGWVDAAVVDALASIAADLAALAAVETELTTLAAIQTQLSALAAVESALVAVAAEYTGGARAPVIVHDSAFNAAAVVVSGLSTSKRYVFTVELENNGGAEFILLRPNSSAGVGFCGFWRRGTGEVSAADWTIQICYAIPMGVVGVIEPRKNGLSVARWAGRENQNAGNASVLWGSGVTSTDFTSLQFVLSATSRTGWLTVIEETP